MNDQYRLEDLDVNIDGVDLKTVTFVNSYYSQPPPSIGPSLTDDVKVSLMSLYYMATYSICMVLIHSCTVYLL